MKYYGKEKCRILKEIRAEIARQNDIEWVTSECKHKGNCKGTCPKCEAEVRELEAALARREALGKKVAVVGVSASIALSVTGCDLFRATGGEPLAGDIAFPETTETTETTEAVWKGEVALPETEETTPDTEVTAGVPLAYETDEETDEGTEPEAEAIMGDVPLEKGFYS